MTAAKIQISVRHGRNCKSDVRLFHDALVIGIDRSSLFFFLENDRSSSYTSRASSLGPMPSPPRRARCCTARPRVPNNSVKPLWNRICWPSRCKKREKASLSHQRRSLRHARLIYAFLETGVRVACKIAETRRKPSLAKKTRDCPRSSIDNQAADGTYESYINDKHERRNAHKVDGFPA